MRIGLFTDTYLPDINGVATAVDTLARELRQLGHEVFVVTTNLARHSRIEREGNLIRIPGIVLKSLYSYRVSSPISPRNFDVLKDVPLDLIHIHSGASWPGSETSLWCTPTTACTKISPT